MIGVKLVFSSIIFLFLFLPLVLLIYYLLPKAIRNSFLIFASLLFYFWGETFLIWILITASLIDYFCGLLIGGGFKKGEIQHLEKGTKRTIQQRFWLTFSILSNLGFLFYFKYCNFFLDTYSGFAALMGFSQNAITAFNSIALPLGISFYTFQTMSYTIDVFRGEVKATRNIIDYACYVTLFPQLVAGPIVRYKDIEDQLRNHQVNNSAFAYGVFRFIIGLGKKVLIANAVAEIADLTFNLPANQLSCSMAWLGAICYTIQIYFDFSGYSDMAIGLGHMFGFTFLENFNYPYISKSIQEFWRRWHISLSTWFRDYLYIPLGGSKHSTTRTYFNLLLVFLLCGLWHGASLTFIIWGLYHGVFLIIERIGLSKVLIRVPSFLNHTYVMLITIVGWVIFRAETLNSAANYLKTMFGLTNPTETYIHPVARYLDPYLILILAISIFASMPVFSFIVNRYYFIKENYKTISRGIYLYISMKIAGYAYITIIYLICCMNLASGTYNPFIYFRF